MKMIRVWRWMGVLALLMVPACGREYAAGVMDRDAIIAAGETVTAEAYPNSDTVVVDGHIIVRYNADGTGTRWQDTAIKILTEAGKRENQTGGHYFTVPYEEVKLLRLELIKPDGSVDRIPILTNSRAMIDPDQMSENIYNPNRKILGYRVPGLEVGDIVRCVSRHKMVQAPMPGAFYGSEMVEYAFPIKHFVYEVFGPKDLPRKTVVVRNEIPDTIDYTTGERDGKLHYRWEVRDVPRFFHEPDMPPLSRVLQRVHGSTLEDWKTVSRWYWGLCEPHIQATTPQMQATVDDLIAGKTDRQAKIEAIFYWVARNVRYMGITTETVAPGYEPHDVSVTFENKYGVCRDKAALLAAMLRLGGFEAETVLIHPYKQKDAEVPDTFFGHAVTAVREPDGSWQLMDSTPTSLKHLLPDYLRERSYLVATEAGETLATSPPIGFAENLLRVESTGELAADGSLTYQTVMYFDGVNDDDYRNHLAAFSPTSRREFFERVAESIVVGGRLVDLDITPTEMHNTAEPLVVKMKIASSEFLIGGDRCSLMRVPFASESVGTVHFILNGASLCRRMYPLRTGVACGVRERMRVKLPDELASLILPTYDSFDDETLTWNRSLAIKDGELIGENEYSIKVVEFSPEQYQQLAEALRGIEYNTLKRAIFLGRPAASPSPSPRAESLPEEPVGLIGPDDDAIILDRRVFYEIEDAHNWTERRYMKLKVVTLAGRKQNSEVRFRYNTACGEVRLVSGSVTAPGGTVKEVRDEEVNLMDSGWVATAPRYPPSKILVVSFPNVEVGSVIEYEIERTCRDQPFFHASEAFQNDDPVASKIVEIRAPADLPLKILPRFADGITMTRRAEGDTVIHEWSAADVPSLRYELFAPWASEVHQPTVLISAGDWAEYAGRFSEVLEAATDKSDAAAAKARQLVEGLEGDEARILAIRNFVAGNIRSVPVGLHEVPLEAMSSSADGVLAGRYGYSADRAILLAAMMRAIGCEPTFVLRSSRRDVPLLGDLFRQCPQEEFHDVLVRVECDGQQIYLDAHTQYGVLGTTGGGDTLGLVLPEGEVIKIDLAADKRSHLRLDYHVILAETGDADVAIVNTYQGYRHGAERRRFAEMTPEQRRRDHDEAVAAISHSARADGELVTEFETYPGRMSFRVKAERYGISAGDLLYMDLPKMYFGLLLPSAQARKSPVFWFLSIRESARFVVELPEGSTDVLLAPESYEWRAPANGGSVVRRVAQEADPPRLVIEYDVDIRPTIIPAADYDKLLELRQLIRSPRAYTIVLRKND